MDALCALADRKGYTLVHTDLAAINAFFVRSELAAGAAPPAARGGASAPTELLHAGLSPSGRSPTPTVYRPRGGASRAIARSGTLRRIDPVASPRPLTPELARELAARTDFVWHQRFELAGGVYTPGASDIPWLMNKAAVPERLDGATVLDIGTTNGGAAFECERRGARRVVAVDIADENWFGFATLKRALGSSVEHVQASIYELPEVLGEQFDVVLFWGVLYHLRHPLLALDNVRRLARGTVSIETAVSDHELGDARDLPSGTLLPHRRVGRGQQQLVRTQCGRADGLVPLVRTGTEERAQLARSVAGAGHGRGGAGRPRVDEAVLRAAAELLGPDQHGGFRVTEARGPAAAPAAAWASPCGDRLPMPRPRCEVGVRDERVPHDAPGMTRPRACVGPGGGSIRIATSASCASVPPGDPTTP